MTISHSIRHTTKMSQQTNRPTRCPVMISLNSPRQEFPRERLRHSVQALPPASTPSDYREHHLVQTGSRKRVPQTGSTNNLTTETDIDAMSVAIHNTYVFGIALLSVLTMAIVQTMFYNSFIQQQRCLKK